MARFSVTGEIAAPDRNYELLKKKSQLFIQFPYIWLSNSKYVKHKKFSFFSLKY